MKIIVVLAIAILALVTVNVASADGHITHYSEARITIETGVTSLDSKNVDLLIANGSDCWGITYYVGVGDNMFGSWQVQIVENPIYHFHGGNHFNPIEACETY